MSTTQVLLHNSQEIMRGDADSITMAFRNLTGANDLSRSEIRVCTPEVAYARYLTFMRDYLEMPELDPSLLSIWYAVCEQQQASAQDTQVLEQMQAQQQLELSNAFALSRAEEMAALGITEDDFADRAAVEPLLRLTVEEPSRKTFRQAHPERAAAWLKANNAFRRACQSEGMVMERSVRIPAMAGILNDATITSSVYATPEQLDRLTGLVENGRLLPDWTWAEADEPAPIRSLPVLPSIDLDALHGTRADENGLGFDIG